MNDSAIEIVEIPLPSDADQSVSDLPIEVEDDARPEGHFSVDYRRC